VAESHSRFRNWASIAAFTLIIGLTVAEGVDEGFSVWDWIVIAVSAVFIVQALVRLNASADGRQARATEPSEVEPVEQPVQLGAVPDQVERASER